MRAIDVHRGLDSNNNYLISNPTLTVVAGHGINLMVMNYNFFHCQEYRRQRYWRTPSKQSES